jgi:hypothetical protein
VVRCHSLTLGRSDEKRVFHQERIIQMLDIWPWEALPSFSSTNNLFKVAKRLLNVNIMVASGGMNLYCDL